jgi:hypothetical protein
MRRELTGLTEFRLALADAGSNSVNFVNSVYLIPRLGGSPNV